MNMKNRIEGLINIAYLSDFDKIVSRLIDDLQNEEPFETDDIIEYLSERIVYREGSPEAEADWDNRHSVQPAKSDGNVFVQKCF